jgi:cobalamin biosynthesis protein CbiG
MRRQDILIGVGVVGVVVRLPCGLLSGKKKEKIPIVHALGHVT